MKSIWLGEAKLALGKNQIGNILKQGRKAVVISGIFSVTIGIHLEFKPWL